MNPSSIDNASIDDLLVMLFETKEQRADFFVCGQWPFFFRVN